MDADRTFKSPERRRRFIRLLLQAQKRFVVGCSAANPFYFLLAALLITHPQAR
jgi:hypothetical protein